MQTELIHIGFGNMLAVNRIIAITSPQSAPIKRMIQDGKNNSLLVDMTNGRKTKAVLVLDSGHVALASLAPETIAGRIQFSRSSKSKAFLSEEEVER